MNGLGFENRNLTVAEAAVFAKVRAADTRMQEDLFLVHD